MNLSVSDVLSQTVNIVKSRIWSLVGLILIFFVIQIVFSGIILGAVGSTATLAGLAGGGDPSALGALGLGTILFMVVLYVGYLYVSAAQGAALARQASPLVEPNFGESLVKGFSSGLTLLGAYILLLIAYFVGALALGLVAGVFALLGEAATLIVALLFIPLLIYLVCRIAIIAPVVSVDGVRNPITAITRTWGLTKGHVLTIFLAILAITVIALFLLGVPIFMMAGSMAALESDPGAGAAIGSFLALFGVIAILGVVVVVISSALISSIHAGLSTTVTDDLGATFD